MYEDLVGKRLLVLGGTKISCEIIETAKRMGILVGVTDYDPVERSPGKQIADETYDVSTINIDSVVNLIREKRFDGVITGFSDMLLPYYAKICEESGLPSYGTYEQFDIFTNKRKFKRLCFEYGVPTIKQYDRYRIDEEKIIFPVIVKPVDNSGSRGIFICSNLDELKCNITRALACSKSKDVIIERYMCEREVTVNWLFVDGEYYLTGIANRHLGFWGNESIIPLPVGYTYPASITLKYRDSIENKVKKMLQSVGIKNGMMFMQCKVENDICYVYDVGYRLTGALEYKNFAATCGYNPLEMMISFALTGNMCEKTILKRINAEHMKPSFNVSFIAEPGTIQRITGIEETKRYPELLDVVIAHSQGDTITEDMKGQLSQITVRAFGTVDQKSDLFRVMKKVEESIHILSSDGTEMRKRGITEENVVEYVL